MNRPYFSHSRAVTNAPVGNGCVPSLSERHEPIVQADRIEQRVRADTRAA